MALDTVRAAIEAAFVAGWVDGEEAALTTISWPNYPFTPPDNSAWVAVDVHWGDGFMETKGVGTGLNTVSGWVALRIAVPVNDGDGALYDLADAGRTIFTRVQISTALFAVPSGVQMLPVDEGEKWRVGVVTCPFTITE